MSTIEKKKKRQPSGVNYQMTFLDFVYSTLFDTVRSRWAFGVGIDAFDTFHRATSIHYENRYGV